MARLIPISLGARFINATTDMQAAAPAEEITRLLRMLGASPAKVAGLVLFEALWLALLATMLGMLGGHGLVELIGHWLQAERSLPLSGRVWVSAEAWVPALALGVAALAALLPALGAYRLDVTTLLNSR